MVQIWESCEPLQLISPVNTDYAIFIWRGKPNLSFFKKYQDTIFQNCFHITLLIIMFIGMFDIYAILRMQ